MDNNIGQIDTFTNDFDKVIKNNLIYRFTNEFNNTFDDDRKQILIKVLKNINKEKEIEIDTKQLNKNKLNDFLDKITNNKFKQTWSRLNYDQKFMKIEEFINNYEYKSSVNKKNIIKHFKYLLDKNKLSSSKEVSYDKETCKITAIKDFNEIIKNI